MSYLLYASNEMYSSTELLRKSKIIFDKVSKKEIDKAIILRDGKPTFILFDFKKYENIMKEYEHYKTFYNTYNSTTNNTSTSKNSILPNKNEISIKKQSNLSNEDGDKNSQVKLDKTDSLDFSIALGEITVDEIPSGEIKEFWNE